MIYSNKSLDTTKFIEVAENYYAEIEGWLDKYPSEKHRELCKCISARRNNLTFTGQSSCAIRPIPRTDSYENRPHCITEVSKGSDLIRWRYGEADQDATIIDDIRVASPIRTICDLAKEDSPKSLLVSVNHCLYNKDFTKNQLLSELDKRDIRWKNKIIKVLKFATDKCESPLETIAWIAINNAGFVLPKQQERLYDKRIFIGRVDMSWDIGENKIILELDGMGKYKDAKDLHLEKIREGKLHRQGHKIIRATWGDVTKGKLLTMLEDANIPKRRSYKRAIIK